MHKMKFTINNKYKNYNLLLSKIDNPKYNIYEDLPFVKEELNNFYVNLNNIKIDLIKGENVYNHSFDKKEAIYILNSLKQISEENHNNKLVVESGNSTITKAIGNLINLTIKNVNKGVLELDDFISIYKIVNLVVEIKEIPSSVYKLSGLQDGDLNYRLKSYIYGQGFENLNSQFLSQKTGIEFVEVKSLQYWDYINSRRQFKTWKNKNNSTIRWGEWFFNKEIDYKDKFSIPSMDLESISDDENEKITYIENKNFNVSNDSVFFNLKYSPEHIINRLTKQETIRKHNCDLFYNINLYNSKDNKSSHFYIPIEQIKKFYQKINKQMNSIVKKELRLNNHNKRFHCDLVISDEKIKVSFNISNKGNILDKDFKLLINENSFKELFKKYNLEPENFLSNNLTR